MAIYTHTYQQQKTTTTTNKHKHDDKPIHTQDPTKRNTL